MFAGYLKLMRPGNCLMTALSVLVGAVLVARLGAFYGVWMYAAMVAAFLISGAGNAINDYVDIDADKVNKPARPIPSGKVKPRAALGFSVTLFAAGILLAFLVNFTAFLIAAVNSILLIFYSTHLKERMLVGNAGISYLVGSGFLFGGAAAGNVLLPVVMFFLSAFANMAREIAKDLEDIKGDRLMFLKKALSKVNIAHRFNMDIKGNVRLRYRPRVLSVIAAFCLIVAMAVSPIPYMSGMLGIVYLVLLVPTDLLFLYSVFLFSRRHKQKREYARISKIIKLGMLFGLLAFLLGALI